MKKIFSKYFFMCLFAFSVQMAFGQNYFSKPTAIQNLTDELRYVDNQLANGDATTHKYKALSDKRRFINDIVLELQKEEMTVDSAVAVILPKAEIYKIQPSVRYFEPNQVGLDGLTTVSRRIYIRRELLKLITY